ncbi:MAG: hypothetical protein ACJ798_16000, partial [Phenylobacterium sp.]
LGGAGLLASGAMNGAAAGKAATASLAGPALYADVKAYAGLGEHRTGTPGDQATTRWMVQALKRAGYQVETQGFEYPVFELGRCEIGLDGRTLESFPYWTPKPTPAGGLTAPLSEVPAPGKVALVILKAGQGNGLGEAPPAPIVAAANAGAAAVIAVTQHPLGELAALNRTPLAPAWNVPVVLAAGREEAALKAAATAGRPVTVRLDGKSVSGRAENVVARKPGRGKPVVISTPKSGWFHCAGERGSGIAIWIGLARWLATTEMNVVLLAASGHEFDGYGGGLFAKALAPKPAETALWVHIGANVASYDFALRDGRIVRQAGPAAQRLLAVSEPLLPAAAKAFAGQVGYAEPFDIDKRKAPGEIAHYQELGYAPLIGMVAASPLHHTRRDLPDVTGPELLEPVARSLASLIAEAA